MKKAILSAAAIVFLASAGYAQDTQDFLGQLTQAYTGNETTTKGMVAGFSIGGVIGGIIFGSIGVVAFLYGEKVAEFRSEERRVGEEGRSRWSPYH